MTTNVTQIAAWVSELALLVQDLASNDRNEDSSSFTSGKTASPTVTAKLSPEISKIKRSISTTMAKIQYNLMGPTELLQQLAYQNQLLACLQWLGEFQILAFIPLNNSVSLEDIAELASVPKSHLSCVVGIMASAGFLQEPELGHVAHTELSAHFVTNMSYHDAAIFLAKTAAPAALHMADAMKLSGASTSPSHSAYNASSGTAVPFVTTCKENPHLRRQWPAYLQHVLAERDGCDVEMLKSLGCFDRLARMPRASVVEIGAETTERASILAKLYPNLNFIVQLSESGGVDSLRPGVSRRRSGLDLTQNDFLSGGRLATYYRGLGTPQSVQDAAVYILDLSPISLGGSTKQISAELRAHLGILRANNNSTLVIISHFLPDRGTIGCDNGTISRLRELCLFQLLNQQPSEASDLSELVNGIHDATGRLSIIKRVYSDTGDAVATEIQYRSYSA